MRPPMKRHPRCGWDACGGALHRDWACAIPRRLRHEGGWAKNPIVQIHIEGLRTLHGERRSPGVPPGAGQWPDMDRDDHDVRDGDEEGRNR